MQKRPKTCRGSARHGHPVHKELPKQEYTTLKGAMWAFRKNLADLEGPAQEVLTRLFSYSPDLERAYTLREQLTAIFEAELSKDQATTKLKDWQWGPAA